MRDEFLSEEDLDLQNLSEAELLAYWDLWLHQAQASNALDEHVYTHGVFMLVAALPLPPDHRLAGRARVRATVGQDDHRRGMIGDVARAGELGVRRFEAADQAGLTGDLDAREGGLQRGVELGAAGGRRVLHAGRGVDDQDDVDAVLVGEAALAEG